jgi:hypothetical protein
MLTAPFNYQDIRVWLQNYKIPTDHLTDKEVAVVYDKEARERVIKLRDEQVKEIYAHAARLRSGDRWFNALAAAVILASEEDFLYLRPMALFFIERYHL